MDFVKDNLAVYVNALLDGIQIKEYLIVSRKQLPVEIVDQLANSYDLSSVSRNRLFEIINSQLNQKVPAIAQKYVYLDISVKGFRLRQKFLFNAEQSSPYQVADQLIIDFRLARNLEEYWIWHKMIIFAILQNYQQDKEGESCGLDLLISDK